jgi:Predicted nucleic acid-binding protein, contains PIN domain
MSFVVVYDANVLYPSTLRDLLIRIAQAGLVQAKWTDQILDEMFRNLRANRPDLVSTQLDRTRTLMNAAVRDCLVRGYQPLVEAVKLPDPDDRHVVAAAIRAGAQMIVTANTQDFPTEAIAQWDIEVRAPDDFICDQIDLDRQAVFGAVQRIADSWSRPPGTVSDVLASLERSGIVAAATALRTSD